ncbi:hypothetical protein CLOACE_07940 [Clostridium acetireducens DSM 10703]|jgi:flagellar operon protein|uniref:Flagellar operon protein n=1 Tax=Clostridium acetireducens DSM 10703 TaxID=1121290 RepID=A0A1E8F085_9CLOT|nr:TIGR02530 family flagellar biosynthesis protein [Clostridium acetireducens]OFI06811.1 hypothetical protein CLOACE_07940 [Clostridium acetireducens DSM 10703]
MGYRVINGKMYITGDFLKNYSNNKVENKKSSNKFSNILEKKIDKNKSFVVSNHALERLKERNINFTEEDMKVINQGINKAEKKGCRQCVMFYKNTALVTSIKNRTVITAINGENIKGNIFTNIDSVLVI